MPCSAPTDYSKPGGLTGDRTYWGVLARAHWQRHLPRRLAALEDPDRFFADLEDEAQEYCTAIRDGLLEGLNPNNGTIGRGEFVTRVDQANAIAREIVGHELIYLPGEDAEEE